MSRGAVVLFIHIDHPRANTSGRVCAVSAVPRARAAGTARKARPVGCRPSTRCSGLRSGTTARHTGLPRKHRPCIILRAHMVLHLLPCRARVRHTEPQHEATERRRRGHYKQWAVVSLRGYVTQVGLLSPRRSRRCVGACARSRATAAPPLLPCEPSRPLLPRRDHLRARPSHRRRLQRHR